MIRPHFEATYRRLSQDGKPILISGPRQSGKTTFAKSLLAAHGEGLYFNWDSHLDRARFVADPLFFRSMDRRQSAPPLVVFDELHKWSGWKPYLKGLYDDYAKDWNFLVTGSGRLDLGKRTGEALTGRYMSLACFPLTLGELSAGAESAAAGKTLRARLAEPFALQEHPNARESWAWWQGLGRHSGFPEPFLRGEETFWRRWSDSFAAQIVREDMQGLHELRRLDKLQLLLALLPSRVGSPLSQQNLAQALGVAFESVKAWLSLFEAFFLVFRIETYTRRIARSILKEKKYYLFNVPEVQDPGARFENLVALELLRSVTRANQLGEGRFGLTYLKNKEQQEVDFLVTEGQEPALLIETKLSQDEPSPALMAFQRQLGVPAVQLVENRETWRRVPNGDHEVLVVAAHRWMNGLP
ncbi:MAG: ATP-binding protein [Spirochaetes bacterium]|nr:ATP-binding protein [Spirochaetota bacterium]